MTALDDAYAELVKKYQRLSIQDGDITCEQFGKHCGMSQEAARNVLEKETEAGLLERIRRTSASGRPIWAYRLRNIS